MELQKCLNAVFFNKLLVLNKVLSVFKPTFGERFKPITREYIALITMDQPFIRATQVVRLAFFASFQINTCTGTRVSLTNIYRTSATEHSAGGNSTLIRFVFNFIIHNAKIVKYHENPM